MRRNASPEEKRAYRKAYYAAHKEEYRGYRTKWYSTRKESERQRQQAKYQRDKEKVRERNAARYALKREAILQSSRELYQKTRGRVLSKCWEWRLKDQFGMTPGQYFAMLDAQGGRCAVCRSEPLKRKLGVDHCHATGKVRGLLCHSCNIAIGLLKDSVPAIENLLAYMKRARQ